MFNCVVFVGGLPGAEPQGRGIGEMVDVVVEELGVSTVFVGRGIDHPVVKHPTCGTNNNKLTQAKRQ